jgi:hypothetical protein
VHHPDAVLLRLHRPRLEQRAVGVPRDQRERSHRVERAAWTGGAERAPDAALVHDEVALTASAWSGPSTRARGRDDGRGLRRRGSRPGRREVVGETERDAAVVEVEIRKRYLSIRSFRNKKLEGLAYNWAKPLEPLPRGPWAPSGSHSHQLTVAT